MITRDERRERNQREFGEANQRLHDLVEDRVADITTLPFLCECAAEQCLGRVDVTLGRWEEITALPNHFLIIAGHPRIEGEKVVDSFGRYEIVQKPGD